MRQVMQRSVAAVVLALSLASGVFAQEVSTVRYYVIPKTGTGAFTDPIRPKYVKELATQGQPSVQFSSMSYGLEDTFLVSAKVTPTQHTTLTSNIDVIALPADIESKVSLAALSVVKTRLDGLYVPSDTITTDMTYKDTIREVGKIFLLMQRYHGLYGQKFFQNGGDLDVQLRTLTGHRADLLAAAQDLASTYGFQLNTTGIKGTTTVREALHIIAAQLPGFTLGGVTF